MDTTKELHWVNGLTTCKWWTVWKKKSGTLMKCQHFSCSGQYCTRSQRSLRKNKKQTNNHPRCLSNVLTTIDLVLTSHSKTIYINFNVIGWKGEYQLIPSREIKHPSMDLLCTWMVKSWDSIKIECTVIESFTNRNVKCSVCLLSLIHI